MVSGGLVLMLICENAGPTSEDISSLFHLNNGTLAQYNQDYFEIYELQVPHCSLLQIWGEAFPFF
jgi:hypothetical protein